MTTRTDKMLCPDCGVEMNRHAMKVNYEAGPGEVDADLGGVLEEVYTCPVCGRTHTRSAKGE